MNSTFCVRNYDYYFVELDRLVWRMCCHTTQKPMTPGKDWFNGPEMQERRQAASTGIKHPDCHYCWKLENDGVESSRHHALKNYTSSHTVSKLTQGNFEFRDILEIKLSNICDMACRYCAPAYSSIWAQRLKVYDKQEMLKIRSTDEYKQVFNEFVIWLNRELPRFKKGRGITFTGGEPFLDEKLYELIEELNLEDTHLTFNTNLNTPESKWNQQTSLLTKLISKNNTIQLRCSIDGIGKQQEWQRQGSDWNLMKENWLRLGLLKVQMCPVTTVTPLTLESMCGVGIFVQNTADRLAKKPQWFQSTIVNWPRVFSPMEWFSSFKDEINLMIKLVSDSKIDGQYFGPTSQLKSWLITKNNFPTISAKNTLIKTLDETERLYGGGSWREIYPKVSKLAGFIDV